MPNVSVTNRGERFIGRFDGVEYVFDNMEAVVIPERAAAFLFAYGQDDAGRTRALVRNGWQRNGTPDAPDGPLAAKKRLNAFIFRAAPDAPGRPKPQAKVLAPVVRSAEVINIPGTSAPLAPASTSAPQAAA